MSPRGVAIPDVQRQLFDAAERVLRRDGPEGLSSRAITTEAAMAKGLLYLHFHDLDAFLAAFVVDRARRATEAIGGLPARAGGGDVVDNLTEAALSFAPQASALVDLVRARWSLAAQLARSGHLVAGGLQEIEATFAAYLEAERRAGRLAAETDTSAVATALVATVHQLAVTQRSAPDYERDVRRVISALVSGATRHTR